MSFLRKNRTTLIITLLAVATIIVGMSALLTAEPQRDKPDFNVRVAKFYPSGEVTEPTNITV